LASWLFGRLIDLGARSDILYGNIVAAVILIGAVIVVLCFGVRAELTALEDVAAPLSAAGDEPGEPNADRLVS
jgi:hypothetical protein